MAARVIRNHRHGRFANLREEPGRLHVDTLFTAVVTDDNRASSEADPTTRESEVLPVYVRHAEANAETISAPTSSAHVLPSVWHTHRSDPDELTRAAAFRRRDKQVDRADGTVQNRRDPGLVGDDAQRLARERDQFSPENADARELMFDARRSRCSDHKLAGDRVGADHE